MVSNSISCMVLCPAAAACWAATHGQMTMSPSTPSITVLPSPGRSSSIGKLITSVGPSRFIQRMCSSAMGSGYHEHDGQVGLGAHAQPGRVPEYPKSEKSLGSMTHWAFIGDVNAHRLSRFGWLRPMPLAGGHRRMGVVAAALAFDVAVVAGDGGVTVVGGHDLADQLVTYRRPRF